MVAIIIVITGPPCSGKTTYARQHAKPGDLIIDFDAIAQALGSPVRHGHDDTYRKAALDARDAAITAAVSRIQRVGAWIIDSRPTPKKRDWYKAHGARFVNLSAEPAELHRRADADGRPASWHQRIDQFLADSASPVEPRTRW